MLLQNESIKTEHILQSLNHNVSDTRCIGKGILRESFGDIGPFCATAINRYLYKHASPMVYYKALLSNQQNATGLTHAQFLALLPPGTKGAGVSFTPQGYTCGHMKCIRYIEADQTWYALDSWLGDFITPLLTDSDWKHHTKNASIYALLYADTFPWNHMGVPCPNYLHNSMIEIDNDRPFDLNQPLTIHHNPIRTVNDQYTPPEVTQHTEHTVGPIVVNLVPLNDPAQISSAADPMEQDAHELLTDPSRPAEPPAATRITTQNADTPMANTPSCPVLTRVPRLPDIRDFFAPAAPTPPQDEHAKAPQEDQMGEQRDEPSSPPHSNAHGEQEIEEMQEPNPPATDDEQSISEHTGQSPPSSPIGSSRCVPELERPHVDYDQRQAQCLKVMTQNIRGLHTGLEDIQTILREHQPDILIVTETKLTKKGRSRISQQLAGQGYRQRHSVRYQLKPQAGVTLLIKKSFDELGDISDISTPDHLTGYMRGVQISLPGCTPLDIVGVYMPTTHPDDKHTRADIYDTAAHLAENQSINQSKRKTSNANGQTNLGHKHKAPDHNHEATQPMVDLPHTS